MSLRYRIPQILLVMALALVALPQLWYPFGFDQMVYAACGDVIRRGGVPIRDCFETKQMGVMVMYAIPMLISQTAWAVHAFTLAWQIVTSFVIARVARDVFGTRAAWPAAIIYWLMYAGINYWSMDQAETFANLFLLLAFWQVFKGSSRLHSPLSTLTSQLFFAGLCVGVTFWFKYIFVLVGVAMGGVLILRLALIRPRLGLGSWLLHLGAFALGALLPMLLGVFYYALQTDGLWTLQLQLNFLRENFPLTEPLPPDGMARMMLRFFDNGADASGDFKRTLATATAAAQVLGGGFPFIIALGAFGFLRAMIQPRPKSSRAAALYLLAYLVTAIILCIWQGNYIQYHYTLMHVPVALLAAAAFATDDTQPTTLVSKTLFSILYVVFFLAVGLLIYRMTPLMIDAYDNVLVQRKSLRDQYLESKQGPHIPVSEYIRNKTGPDDTIAIFGDAPWVYTLSGRRNATRFSFVNVWIKKRHTPSYALYVQQFADGLAQNKPVYVLLTKADFPWLNNDYIADYKLATPIYNYVEANYAYEGENGPFLLFRRKS